jgi:hypothetical protein
MKKLAIFLIVFLLFVSVFSANAEEKSFLGSWVILWNNETATMLIEDVSLVPGTVVVSYYSKRGDDGFCTQAKVHNSTLILKLDTSKITLKISEDGTIIGEKCFIMRLKRVNITSNSKKEGLANETTVNNNETTTNCNDGDAAKACIGTPSYNYVPVKH